VTPLFKVGDLVLYKDEVMRVDAVHPGNNHTPEDMLTLSSESHQHDGIYWAWRVTKIE
jgi:hypothetical protein